MINISLKYSHKYGTRMSTHSRDWRDVKLNIISTNQQKSTFLELMDTDEPIENILQWFLYRIIFFLI